MASIWPKRLCASRFWQLRVFGKLPESFSPLSSSDRIPATNEAALPALLDVHSPNPPEAARNAQE